MAKKQPDTSGYRTEEQLKEEAKRRAAQQARMAAAKPEPPAARKKMDNFWYHYKWHTIAAAVLVVLAIFFVRDVVLSTDPDATVVIVSGAYLDQETLDTLQLALEERAPDRNGDGDVVVSLDFVQMAFATGEAANDMDAVGMQNADYAATMKLTTVVAAGIDPLYLLDEGACDYFRAMGVDRDDEGNLLREPVDDDIYHVFRRLGLPGTEGALLPVEDTELAENPALQPLGGLRFAVRDSLKDEGYTADCLELLAALMK